MADDQTQAAAGPGSPSDEVRDYRPTIFLPATPFPMRAGLPKQEPEALRRWAEQDLYAALRADRQGKGATLYALHDGPPYANGAIHIGHALNKILKDFVVRSRFALGYDVDYVPGWDCHGLPIEWKIEERYRKKGRRKDDVPVGEFRAECRAYAAAWIAAQSVEFQRLGVLGRWDRPYATMDFASEAAIVGEFHKYLMSGQLVRGSKPVMWSPVERTALADAEVEYYPHNSPTVWVRFPVASEPTHPGEGRDPGLQGASAVIWTTTPWTIPANRAVAYNPTVAYGLYRVEGVGEALDAERFAKTGDRLIVADALHEAVFAAAKITAWTRQTTVDAAGLTLAHPLATQDAGYGFPVPMLAGDHVTAEAGTGFVHTAPGHGADDYAVWLANGRRDIPDTVDADGAYYDHVPLFGGMKVMETEGSKAGKFGPANGAVIDALVGAGTLLARGRVEHSYPHSWRSKAPVIFRNTPQWFIRMDGPTQLRQAALAAVDATAFHPQTGQTRIRAMVETRPDWLISRQRAWGAPLAMFVDRATGAPLRDPAVNARILAAIAAEGADAWFTRPTADFLGPDRDPADYEKIEDILDVWFDSGSTHAFVLEPRVDAAGTDRTKWPADLYLEGSDQARGWFQSSLLESCGTRGRAPYDAVLTHGFTLAEGGEKMSKSAGNTVEPQKVIAASGADILRLWVAMVDYAEDQRIGDAVLQTTADSYRKLRNTLRYLLGALDGFSDAERVEPAAMPPLERFILHRLWALDGQVRRAYAAYRFSDVLRPILEFCTGDLSALYFDIRKDSLYCDRPDAPRRKACRTVMEAVFARLTVWLAPLLPFTMDEAWRTRFPESRGVAFETLPQTPDDWRNDAEAERWESIKFVVGAVNLELEVKRNQKIIGSSLEASPSREVSPKVFSDFEGIDAAEVFRTSSATIIENPTMPDRGMGVSLALAEGCKCTRCWRILPEVTAPSFLCLRCDDAVRAWDAGAPFDTAAAPPALDDNSGSLAGQEPSHSNNPRHVEQGASAPVPKRAPSRGGSAA